MAVPAPGAPHAQPTAEPSPGPAKEAAYGEEYDADPRIAEKVLAEEVQEPSDSEEPTQPAENTQASQARLLLPENRCRLARRFARHQMVVLSMKISEHDAKFDPQRTVEELQAEIFADLGENSRLSKVE